MNIIEAIKSAKRFKRSLHKVYKQVNKETGEIEWYNGDKPYILSREDILANDWEVQEPIVTLTEYAFNSAWDGAYYKVYKRHAEWTQQQGEDWGNFYHEVKQHLGLEERFERSEEEKDSSDSEKQSECNEEGGKCAKCTCKD